MLGSFMGNSGSGTPGIGASLLSGGLGALLTGMNPAPRGPDLPNQSGAAASLFGDIGGMTNPFSGVQPVAFDQLLAMMNNPYLKQYMQAAGQSGQAFTGAGNQAGQGANLLMQNARGLEKSGFDPQHALQKQLQGQVQDQSNVNNAMYGLQSSPYGAGVANQNMTNFDINWQNQQLQRQLAAQQGIGADVSGAQGLNQARANDFMAGGAAPYGAYRGGVGDINSALQQYLTMAQGGNQSQNQALQDWMQYLGLGNAAANTNQNAYGMNQNTAGMYGAGLFPFLNNMGGSSSGFPDAQPPSGPYASQIPIINGNLQAPNLQPVSAPTGYTP